MTFSCHGFLCFSFILFFFNLTTLYLFYWCRDCFNVIHQEFFIQLLYVYNFTVGMLLEYIWNSLYPWGHQKLGEVFFYIYIYFILYIYIYILRCWYRSWIPENWKVICKCVSQRRIEECWYSILDYLVLQ